MKRTVSDVESLLQHAFQSLPHSLGSPGPLEIAPLLNPRGFEPVIEVLENGRKKRRDASVDKLNFEEIEYKIYFVRSNSSADASPSTLPPDTSSSCNLIPPVAGRRDPLVPTPSAQTSTRSPAAAPSMPSCEDELCSALEEIERQARPFVALKWFRDEVLAHKNFAWAGTTEARQAVLARAVESGRVVTSRIPNPRSPYPTTTIRLNRSRAIGDRGKARYNPRPIRGAGLSETILSDRGIR